MSISLITRADDLGASHSANIAIAGAAATVGYIKNISCMAVGPWIDEGAELLRDCPGICLGLHAAINSEWDPLKWGPISSPEEVPTLVNAQGTFFSDPSLFAEHPPDIDQILLEYDRQLDLLTSLGLDIRYVDSHMLPELFVDGLAEAVSGWAQRKGLVDHLRYYRFPSKFEPGPFRSFDQGLQAYHAWFDLLDHGTYFTVMHPAKASREMLLCRNEHIPMGLVSTVRDVEYQLLQSHRLEEACEKRDIRRLRYDEAEATGVTFQELSHFLKNDQEGESHGE
ncbi:MAG: ChbG/HpnK family deacetylase [Anaerolineaceae bacterium]